MPAHKQEVDPNGRHCRACGKFKPWVKFYRRTGGVNGRAAQCDECIKDTARLRPSFIAKYGYTITRQQFNKLLKKQRHRCAICHRRCSSGFKLAVDHDHNSGELRGLLCRSCNLGLGNFKDSPELLELAAAYLRLHKRNIHA